METMKNKNQLIGCCGLDCENCDTRIATITNDNTLREKTAARWTKLNGVTITPEMINCTGCRIDGAKTPFCDKLCPVHNFVRETSAMPTWSKGTLNIGVCSIGRCRHRKGWRKHENLFGKQPSLYDTDTSCAGGVLRHLFC